MISQNRFNNYYSKSEYDNDFSEKLFDKYQKKLSSDDKSKSLIWNNVLSENYLDVYDA